MKVLGVYDKSVLDKLKVNKRPISLIMEEFWSKFPESYRANYDKNIETLELWKVDEHYDDCLGDYSDSHNLILFRRVSAIVHELMHVAARDGETKINSFVRDRHEQLFETPLIEGCAEYLSSLALNEDPTCYFFEVFSVSMLSDIDGFFEPYFIPSYDNFIKLFPRKKDIISLMYSLYFYAENYGYIGDVKGKEKDILITRLKHSIMDTISSLISIELSFNKGDKSNIIYADKFLSLIKEGDLTDNLNDIWKGYSIYAESQVKKRILRR